MEKITLGSGCFWCTEAIYNRLEGVESAISGYSGGKTKDPFYKEVCAGKTGHAEVVQVTFDPEKVSIEEVLKVFWETHDPTTLNRQGNDVGTQYRSVVFYHTEEQKEIAEKIKKSLDEAGIWSDPIVTEITQFDKFWPAENYHKEYFESHGHEPYCNLVIKPKVEKFEKAFSAKLKK
jgi:peptide-methionine (S)-S-oxide reductase